jgi:Rieske Fe-S protein
MPADEDKYPTASGRRRFVKGVVGSAALAGVTAGSAAALNTATNPSGAGGGPTQYVAIELVDGPAPRGLPIIPVEIEGGELRGLWPDTQEVQQGGRTVTVAQQEVGGITYASTWFQYCGLQGFPSVEPTADADTTLLASDVADGYAWMEDVEEGAPLTVDMFDDYEDWGNGIGRSGLGKPGRATWRNMEGSRPLPVQVLRTPELPAMIDGEGRYSSISGPVRNYLEAATAEDFMVWLNKCTHFCCTPSGFKSSDYSGAEDRAYCQCHQSIYNPFSPVQQQFVALPRPED